jgi:hypothetical protein
LFKPLPLSLLSLLVFLALPKQLLYQPLSLSPPLPPVRSESRIRYLHEPPCPGPQFQPQLHLFVDPLRGGFGGCPGGAGGEYEVRVLVRQTKVSRGDDVATGVAAAQDGATSCRPIRHGTQWTDGGKMVQVELFILVLVRISVFVVMVLDVMFVFVFVFVLKSSWIRRERSWSWNWRWRWSTSHGWGPISRLRLGVSLRVDVDGAVIGVYHRWYG